MSWQVMLRSMARVELVPTLGPQRGNSAVLLKRIPVKRLLRAFCQARAEGTYLVIWCGGPLVPSASSRGLPLPAFDGLRRYSTQHFVSFFFNRTESCSVKEHMPTAIGWPKTTRKRPKHVHV